MEHNYKNVLCFASVGSKLCPNKAFKELRDTEGNTYGLFCYKHINIEKTELFKLGIKLI